MQQVISYADYTRISSAKTAFNHNIHQEYTKTVAAIATYWSNHLSENGSRGKVAALLLIATRTLFHGKMYESIPVDSFLTGYSQGGLTYSGIGVKSKNTLKTILQELADEGFIHIFRTKQEKGNAAKVYTFFEINCKFIQKAATAAIEIVKGSILTMLNTPRKPAAPVGGIRHLRVPRKATVEGGQPLTPIRSAFKDRKILKTLIIGASPDESRPSNLQSIAKSTPTQVVENIQARNAERRAAQANQPFVLHMQSMQRVIDGAMARFHPTLPRVVITGKMFSEFKKKTLERNITDHKAFIEYCIRDWTNLAQSKTISAQNRQRIERKIIRESDMLLAPTAGCLCYTVPFFAGCYANHTVRTERYGSEEDQKDKKIAKLQRQVAQTKRESAGLKARNAKAYNLARNAQTAEAPEVVAPVSNAYKPRAAQITLTPEEVAAIEDSFDMSDVPEWK